MGTVSLSGVHERRPRSVEEAEAELARFQKAESDLSEELKAITTKLMQAEDAVGDTILDARLQGDEDKIQQANSDLSHKWLAADTARRALESAKIARIHAERNVLLAKAGEKRTEAVQLRAEEAERMKKTNALLKELNDFEEARFGPLPVPHPSGAGYQFGPITKSQKLIEQALTLESQAKSLENQAKNLDLKVNKKGAG